jgi:hypothetical protein
LASWFLRISAIGVKGCCLCRFITHFRETYVAHSTSLLGDQAFPAASYAWRAQTVKLTVKWSRLIQSSRKGMPGHPAFMQVQIHT